MNQSFIDKYMKGFFKSNFKINVKKYTEEKLCDIEGRYLKYINIDGQRYFTFNEDLPF